LSGLRESIAIAIALCSGCSAPAQGVFALSARGVAAFGSRDEVQTTSSATAAGADVSAAGGAKFPDEFDDDVTDATGYSGESLHVDVRGRAIGLEAALQFPAIDVVAGIDWSSINDHGVRDVMIGLRKRLGSEKAQPYLLVLGRHSTDHYDGDHFFNGFEAGFGFLVPLSDWAFLDFRMSWSLTEDLAIESEIVRLEESKFSLGFGVAW
jgi:hypothetical protein